MNMTENKTIHKQTASNHETNGTNGYSTTKKYLLIPYFDAKTIVCHALSICRQYGLWIYYTLFFSFIIGIGLFRYDRQMYDTITFSCSNEIREWIHFYSDLGDFPVSGLLISVVLYLVGSVFNKKHWCILAISIFLASSVAGLSVKPGKYLLGRPRPGVEMTDRFYFFQKENWQNDHHSFPSGHSATAMAFGVTMAVAVPPLAVPSIVFSISIGYSRILLERHHFSDVFVGGMIGIVVGLIVGFSYRRYFYSIRDKHRT
jgi:membrane-associated phospholipid phosphatase